MGIIIFASMHNEYRIIPGYTGYRISNKGTIQSRWQWVWWHSGIAFSPREEQWTDLKPGRDGKYLQVVLKSDIGKRKTFRVHILVCMAFLGPKKDRQIVRHLDGNGYNNDLSNLTYGTYKENEGDKINHGTWNTRNGGAKITPLQVQEIREKLKNGSTEKALAVEYGVSRPTVTRIKNYKIWK